MASLAPTPNADLAPLTTLGVAARAAWITAPETPAEVFEAFKWACDRGLPTLVLGGGSNLVFASDFPGLVLRLALRGREKIGETTEAHRVRVAAGESWHETVGWTLEQGWPGLENLALIPGSVGAAPVQNIGAYGLELTERFESLDALNVRTGEIVTLDQAACRFGYRDSIFKHADGAGLIVLAVTFALPKHWAPHASYRDIEEELASVGVSEPTPHAIFDAVVRVRRRKLPDPVELGNVGSFFKNPVVSASDAETLRARFPDLVSYTQADGRVKLAAGWLIDRAGWKGSRLGNAGVHERQALVLINRGGATGAEILALAARIRADVEAKFNVRLEQEPVTVGA